MADPSDQRALATRLSVLSDVELTRAFAMRTVSPHAAWRDWFDAAEALLDAASVDRALVKLSRATLRALAAGNVVDAAVRSALLADEAGIPYSSVTVRAKLAAQSTPAAFAAVAAVTAPAPSSAETTAAIAERVHASIGALADLLLTTAQHSLVRTGAGAVSAADRRRLIETGIAETADELDDLLFSAHAAGLLRSGEREWATTPESEAWLARSTGDRWASVVTGLRASLPAVLRTDAGGYAATASWRDEHPLDPAWAEQVARLERAWTRWGLLAENGTEPAWAAPLRVGGAPDAERLVAALPPEIDRVYLQADLSAIAPGPLVPALDLRLRSLAHRESRAQASTYRFSAASIGDALTAGETAASLHEFLAGLSLSGIPQPLAYLIDSTAARHGLVTVQTDAATGGSIVESPDDALRATIAIDQALRPLGLVPDGDRLVSRVASEAVYWSLVDARYPVVAIDDAGDPVSLRRGARAVSAVPATSEYERLISRLRAGGTGEGDTDAAWLERELDVAVRARAVIEVEVRLPDGVTRTFTLEASGLGGGRLRGRDRGADVERTLPLSHIVSVRPAP